MLLRNLPLHRKLPLLTTGVLVIVMGSALGFARPILLRSAEERAANRMARAAREIARGVEQGAQDRAQRLNSAAQRPELQRALEDAVAGGAARAAVEGAVGEVLAAITNPGDTGLVVGLLDRSGQPLARSGMTDAPLLRSALARGQIRLPTDSATAGRPDLLREVRFGPMYPVGTHTRFWATARVARGGTTLGYLAQERRVTGSRSAVGSLAELLGTEVTLYLRNEDGAVYTRALGETALPPDAGGTTGEVPLHTRGEAEFVAAEAAMPGLPWVVVLEAPVAAVRGPAYASLTPLALGALLLTLAGGIVTWVFTRRLSRPIVTLREAADAVARGLLVAPVPVTANDEVGQLAATFNAMAREVGDARRALEWQVADAQRARGEAEQANRTKSDFLAVMSHELRTPLNAIGGYTQLLALGIYGPLSPKQADAVARVERNQEHLLRLINDVLNFARLNAGQIAFDFTAVPLHEALRELDALVIPQVRERGLTYQVDPIAPDVEVHADRDRLRQILLNLLTNAIKFTPAGGEIRIGASVDGEHADVRVTDTGIGIAPDRLTRIFEPFVQGDRALHRPAEGVGLGLTISRDLAVAMGGELSVMSAPGSGATFILRLPRSAPLATVPAAGNGVHTHA